MARALGWRQTRVSKLETGAQRPKDDDLAAWVRVVGAGNEVLTELCGLNRAVDTEYTRFREMYGGRRGGSTQDRYGYLERAATVICHYEPALIPALVQTGQYTRELLSAPANASLTGATPELIEEMVAARMRRQEVLYQPRKRVRIVIGEAALRTWYGAPETLAGQLDRLVAVMDLATVDLGLLPFGRAHPTAAIGGFTLHDQARVFLETLVGAQELLLPDEADTYEKAFEIIRAAALAGPDAVALIQQVAAELRR